VDSVEDRLLMDAFSSAQEVVGILLYSATSSLGENPGEERPR